jgi:hypothetical protein
MRRRKLKSAACAVLVCAVPLLSRAVQASVDGSNPEAGIDAALHLADQGDATTKADAAARTSKDASTGAKDVAPELPAAVAPSAGAADQNLVLSVQDAVRYADLRAGGTAWRNQASLDIRYEKWLTSDLDINASWRVDRFDPMSSLAAPGYTESLLREAYASWRPGALSTLEAGRMNQRVGVAFGYNPTDFFKAGAVDLDVSPDPLSRRTNRLGTIGVRGQQVWDSGSATLLFSPRLASRMEPGNPAASGELQRTNSIGRWMFLGSQRLGNALQPQFVAYGEEGQTPQIGLNLTALFGNAVVAYTEVAAGWRPSLIARMTGSSSDTAFRMSSATGMTYTFPTTNLSISLEMQTNAAGATPAQWRRLAATNPMAWGQAMRGTDAAQELPTRYGAFALAIWRNAFVRRLDISAFAQYDQGGGWQGWLEVRRHFDRFDMAMQLQAQAGPAWDRYGAMTEHNSVQVLATFYR